MDINRNNYEEYFLLYADNELSDQEKKTVEAFVKQHPDVEEEFLLIRQSVIRPDAALTLEDKNFLLREADKFITIYNYQNAFILYNDNELPDSQRKETEAFLLLHPSLGKELEWLQKTKLAPDTNITFPGRRSLLKSEEDNKVVRFAWWKLAAAAILAGAGIFTGIAYLQNHERNLPVTVKNTGAGTINKSAPVSGNKVIPDNLTEKPAIAAPTEAITSVENIPAAKASAKQKKEKYTVQKDKEPNAPAENPNQPIHSSGRDVVTDIKIEKQDIVTDPGPDKNSDPVNKKAEEDNSVYRTEEDDIAFNKGEAGDVFSPSYSADENAARYNYAFYNVTEEKFNKSKLGGFLRKMKRIIERKSPFYKIKDKSEMAVK